MRCWVADAYAEGGLRQLAGSDVLFFNSVFLSKDRTAAGRQLAQDHAQAFIFTTAMPGEIPAIGTSGSHKFDVHLTASRRLAFTVATPIGLADARAPLIAIHEAEYLEEPDFFVPLEPE